MKITKREYEARVAAAKKAIAGNLRVTMSKNEGVVKTSPHVEVTQEHYSFSKYLRGQILGIWDDSDAERGLFRKALSADIGTRGGILLPPAFAAEVLPLLKDKAVVRNMPGIPPAIDMTGKDSLTWGQVDAGPTMTWGLEAATMTEDTTLLFKSNTLRVRECTCMYKISEKLLRNAGPSVDGIVRMEMTDAMANEEDQVFLEGTGGNEPLGVYYNPRVNSTDLSGYLDTDDLKRAIYQVALSFASINGWVGAPRTPFDIARFKDAAGRPIFGTGPGEPSVTNLWGAPLKTTTKVAITLMPDTSETYLVGGDWTKFWIGQEGGIEISASDQRYWDSNQIGLKLIRRVGYLLPYPGSFVVIKGIQSAS